MNKCKIIIKAHISMIVSDKLDHVAEFSLQNPLFYDIKLIQLGSRPKARRQILDLLIGVRILSPQPKN